MGHGLPRLIFRIKVRLRAIFVQIGYERILDVHSEACKDACQVYEEYMRFARHWVDV